MPMTQEKFTLIVDDTKKIVLSAVRKHLLPEYSHAVDDVVQETYFRAYRHLAKQKFRGEAKVSTWLYKIAVNESLRMNQKLEREKQKAQKLMNKIKSTRQVQGVQENENQSADSEKAAAFSEIFQRLISLLPLKFAQSLNLYAKGHSIESIAQKLSLPEGTVKSRIFRAKKMIQKSKDMLQVWI